MWTVVYLAQEEKAARTLATALERAGILQRVRPVIGEQETSYEVLVPETEVPTALEIIIDTGF